MQPFLDLKAACVPFVFDTGDSVVVCVNNLGALSSLEMAVITRAAIICLGNYGEPWLAEQGITTNSFIVHVAECDQVVSMVTESRSVVVARVMCGSFMTSLEMAGLSLTLLKVNQETLRLIGEHMKASCTFVPRAHVNSNDIIWKRISSTFHF